MESKPSKAKLYLVLFAVILLAALGGVYYYMVLFSNTSLEDVSASLEQNLNRDHNERVIKQSEIDSKDAQIKLLKAQTSELKKEQGNVSNKLRYSIKPKEKVVAHCVEMKIGKWAMPEKCANELRKGVGDMVAQDNKIVAFEISGVVDTLPYAGLSPELKQEGLASFRAREGMRIVSKKLPNVAVFEGVSQQNPRQRGFIVRAYYVE